MRNVVYQGGSAGYTYFSTELREGKGGARLHPAGRLADDGKRLCEVRAVRNVVDEGGSAGYTYFSTEPREGTSGAGLHLGEGWRMTGSAFAILSRAERCVQVGSAG